MIKVHILTQCDHCDGEAYLPAGEAESYTGERYTRYQPCPQCEGSGKQAKWVSLQDFLEMLAKAASQDPLEPDWLELARKQSISQYQDSRDAAGI